MASAHYEKVATLNDVFEAQLLETMLKERNIPYILRSYEDEAYGGLFQFTLGWGAIEAPREHVETIRELLEEIRQM
ncbi:MAG: hypothetical protein IMX04_04545 [Candidatus Carbobacillus altaicus]|uniref:DUF2007 domain-containing protein n=1 Tax=Candidatus Carbonibacillus altaicus TaxID=2163959 RepID=A0A2R6Y5I6_9BACL|nr:hypothetical protein [Candidatus Carbobacillus altaicus]PTQ57918.1 MAG: hypothetical protein BSOLF_0429 [Candidatus Carbobacillus altaicus]